MHSSDQKIWLKVVLFSLDSVENDHKNVKICVFTNIRKNNTDWSHGLHSSNHQIYQILVVLTLSSDIKQSTVFKGNNKVWGNWKLCHYNLQSSVCFIFCARLILVFKYNSAFKPFKSAVWTILSYTDLLVLLSIKLKGCPVLQANSDSKSHFQAVRST